MSGHFDDFEERLPDLLRKAGSEAFPGPSRQDIAGSLRRRSLRRTGVTLTALVGICLVVTHLTGPWKSEEVDLAKREAASVARVPVPSRLPLDAPSMQVEEILLRLLGPLEAQAIEFDMGSRGGASLAVLGGPALEAERILDDLVATFENFERVRVSVRNDRLSYSFGAEGVERVPHRP